MIDLNSRVTILEQLLLRAGAGEETALNALLRHCEDRLTVLTHHLLNEFRRVRRWEETGDVLQNALVRLVNAVRSVKPQTARDFLALATLQIRRELIDLARHYYGPEGIGARHESHAPSNPAKSGGHDPADLRHEPAGLAQWTEVHELIDTLPTEERETFGLLFYQGLSQADAAEVLNVSVRTVQRRWHEALCSLHRLLNRSVD